MLLTVVTAVQSNKPKAPITGLGAERITTGKTIANRFAMPLPFVTPLNGGCVYL